MRDTATTFFIAAVLAATAGMIWGLQMAISQDHLMAPAHAHLNLVGWATLALYAIYHRLTPAAGATGLAKLHAVVAITGLVVMVPGIAIAINGGTEAVAATGSIISFASMLIFLFTVFRHGFGARA